MLGQVFSPKAVKLNLESETKDEVFEELLEVLIAAHPDVRRGEALRTLKEREAKMSTGIKPGIAVPHAQMPGISGVYGAIGVSRKGIDYDALDKRPVYLVFLLLTDPEDYEYHLSVMKRLSHLLDSPAFVSTVLEKTGAGEVWDTVCGFDALLANVE